MPRRRLGVVLLLPEPVATEVEGLRRACGDPALGTIPPHITLVPPVNVRRDEIGEALRVLRTAAGTGGAMTLTIGPAATFGPESPTLFLDVGLDRPGLQQLRDALFAPPLERAVDRPFRPHVTLAVEMARDRLEAAESVLRDYRTVVEIGRVTLLEQRRRGTGHPEWVVLADAALGRPVSVERGGVRLEVTDSGIADPEVCDLLSADRPDGTEPCSGAPAIAGRRYVVARTADQVVGALTMLGLDRAQPTVVAVTVAEPYRRSGVGRLLIERAVVVARDGGATRLEADPVAVSGEWLAALGWPERDEPRQDRTRGRPI